VYFFYSVLFGLALFVVLPMYLIRSRIRRGEPLHLKQRFGIVRPGPPSGRPFLWIHAVSVGEIGVARNLLNELRLLLPGARFGVSVSTAAGRDLAERTLDQDAAVFAFPFDLARPVEKALSEARPGLIVLTETELWPLFLERAARRGIPVALVNGRVSEGSFRRYLLVRGFFARTLARLSLLVMQSAEDARRVEALGAPAERVRVLGNLKYDLPAPPFFTDAERLRAAAGGRPVLVAGSTGEGEEALLLDAWGRLPRRPLLVLAPRRPERFDEVARLAEARGLRLLRRSTQDPPPTTPDSSIDVYLLDSIGELAGVYREATLAFAGGSLVATGGQSPIEAWAAGVPVLCGPHMENFREAAARGETLGILRRVATPEELAHAIAGSLEDASVTGRRGSDAARFVSESRGAAASTARAVAALAPALAAGRGSAP